MVLSYFCRNTTFQLLSMFTTFAIKKQCNEICGAKMKNAFVTIRSNIRRYCTGKHPGTCTGTGTVHVHVHVHVKNQQYRSRSRPVPVSFITCTSAVPEPVIRVEVFPVVSCCCCLSLMLMFERCVYM